MTDLKFFARHGRMTEPGPFLAHYLGLPTSVADLVSVVQGLTVHVFWAERYGLLLPPERREEVQLRTMQRRLARVLELEAAPLTTARPSERRTVGNCRDFSLTLASMLQYWGVPARPRCGFGTYFLPDHFEDHWVCEYWNGARQRWILVDAQLDALQREALQIDFDPLDVPRDRFISGGAAWAMCRAGEADPEQFGIFDMHGIDFVKGDFVRDLAALNKTELLPWDCWGLIETPYADLTAADLSRLDELAELTRADVPDFDRVRSLYESDARLRVEKVVHSYGESGVQVVEIG
jgi:hypothetical protein